MQPLDGLSSQANANTTWFHFPKLQFSVENCDLKILHGRFQEQTIHNFQNVCCTRKSILPTMQITFVQCIHSVQATCPLVTQLFPKLLLWCCRGCAQIPNIYHFILLCRHITSHHKKVERTTTNCFWRSMIITRPLVQCQLYLFYIITSFHSFLLCLIQILSIVIGIHVYEENTWSSYYLV